MNLFHKLVDDVLRRNPSVSLLRPVVEKELLHHDILRVLSQQNLLKDLTFIGGTCLRCCYNGVRLSEDLDFTGGANFSQDSLSSMGKVLVENLHKKYGLSVEVSEPMQDQQSVSTWKMRMETRPGSPHLSQQRIHIDICAVPSYERTPTFLINHYGVDMGTSGLIIQAQSREEIYTDKLVAFALRPNRIQYRDIWDIAWLHGQGYVPRLSLAAKKLADRQCHVGDFLGLFKERVALLKEGEDAAMGFKKEVLRFLPEDISRIGASEDYWKAVVTLMENLEAQVCRVLK